MNMLTPPKLMVRVADLRDHGECARLDGFLGERPDATPFHRPGWSRAVEAGTGQCAYMLVAESAGRIAGLLPLTHVRSRLFGTILVSAGFGVDGGIIAETAAIKRKLAEEAIGLAGRLGVPSIELRGGPFPEGWSRVEGAHAGFARDLPTGEAAILAAIPRKQRAEVRRALGNGLDVAVSRDLATHHAVYAESVRNLGSPVFPRRLFAAVLEAFGPDADILTVLRGGRPLSSVLSLYHKGIVYPYWGGGIFEARAARANELMYFALMRHAAERGCGRFDFGRSKTGSGAFAYKKNWGFAPRPIVHAVYGRARDANPLSARYRLQVAAWKRLPLWLANRIGPPIARGLG